MHFLAFPFSFPKSAKYDQSNLELKCGKTLQETQSCLTEQSSRYTFNFFFFFGGGGGIENTLNVHVFHMDLLSELYIANQLEGGKAGNHGKYQFFFICDH